MTNAIFEVEPAQTATTWPVMHQLRPHLDLEQYLVMVARMRQTEGFRLAAASIDGKIGAVAGFRIMEMLWCGKILYVDDLVTDQTMRSRGLGKALLAWLKVEARRSGCGELHLDSGLQRLDAHRFYERESLKKTDFHFAAKISG
jgi:GNAT superfamily N-acetyltransferase